MVLPALSTAPGACRGCSPRQELYAGHQGPCFCVYTGAERLWLQSWALPQHRASKTITLTQNTNTRCLQSQEETEKQASIGGGGLGLPCLALQQQIPALVLPSTWQGFLPRAPTAAGPQAAHGCLLGLLRAFPKGARCWSRSPRERSGPEGSSRGVPVRGPGAVSRCGVPVRGPGAGVPVQPPAAVGSIPSRGRLRIEPDLEHLRGGGLLCSRSVPPLSASPCRALAEGSVQPCSAHPHAERAHRCHWDPCKRRPEPSLGDSGTRLGRQRSGCGRPEGRAGHTAVPSNPGHAEGMLRLAQARPRAVSLHLEGCSHAAQGSRALAWGWQLLIMGCRGSQPSSGRTGGRRTNRPPHH